MFEKTSKRNLFASVFAILTVGSMALFFNRYEPWQPIGSELIPDGGFSSPSATNAFGGWSDLTRLVPDGGFNGSPGVVLTTTSNRTGTLRFTVYNLTNIPAFRVSLRAAAHGVVQGRKNYNVPKAVFYYRDTNGKSLYSLHHGVADLSKDTDWRYYKDFFPVPKNTVDARFHVVNDGIAGVFQVDDLSVTPVCTRPSAPWWKLFFGTLWITSFSVCLFALRPWTRRYGLLITATTLIILTGILLPGELLDNGIKKTNEWVKTTRSHINPPVQKPPAVSIAKTETAQPKVSPVKPKEDPLLIDLAGTVVDRAHLVGHFTLFSLLAFLCALSWIISPSILRRAFTVFTGLVLFAASTEVLQFITADRAAALSDLYVDTTGMAGAVILVLCLRGIQHLINRD
jgi:hypothetical protein